MPRYRDGSESPQANGQDRLLAALYQHALGRIVLKPLLCPCVSKAAGRFLSTRLSKVFIKPFIRSNKIDMSSYEKTEYRSYNDFFARKIRPETRKIRPEPDVLIAPCDGKLTALPITQEAYFTLKHTEYTIASLLKNEALAAKYEGGFALIFRLTVDDYHRYCYVADGEKDENTRIPGILHTVNPIANDVYPIYKENAREYTTLHSNIFGSILVMEVGALLVGKIVNHHGAAPVRRGQEKGYFQFGGSTVVLLLEKNKAVIDSDILANSRANIETIVKMGERIGCACP